MRSLLYTIAKLLGDLNAIKRGRISERLFNRGLGKVFGRFFRWYWHVSLAELILSHTQGTWGTLEAI